MAADQTQFAQGDTDYDIVRKILFKLATGADPENDPRPGDTFNNLLRKLLNRLSL